MLERVIFRDEHDAKFRATAQTQHKFAVGDTVAINPGVYEVVSVAFLVEDFGTGRNEIVQNVILKLCL